MTRILRRFSTCFWVAGCLAPQVTGYSATIQRKPDAAPVCQQPFPLSAYDQLRLEYHEDLEVHEGKAFWLQPGVTSPWASPSFIVDQSGKGLLGRPVRDYRIVNASSLDHAWPSPNAEEILRRAQQAALHTKMDCVWGFTQIAIDEKAQELLTLVTTRGLLRPKVLYFGAKQGPAIFQSLMGSTFGDLKDDLGAPFLRALLTMFS